jgi:hypothetical protein
VKTHQCQYILLGVISFRADPTAPRTLTASVSHLFLLLARSSGSLPWPNNLPFHLVSTPGQERGTSSSLPTPEASLCSLIRLIGPLSCPCSAPASLACSCHSWGACSPLTCAHPDLWVLECQCAHAAKRIQPARCIRSSNLRSQGSFLALTLCQLCFPHLSLPAPSTPLPSLQEEEWYQCILHSKEFHKKTFTAKNYWMHGPGSSLQLY